ncbi:hypothetical protein OA385_00735 [Paracoccaceae bacterium]|nr:hypothetical protein [Paracoccaceae bacterium]
MKKETSRKQDKNQVIWEEFVCKNSIKKKLQVAETQVLMMKIQGNLSR